MSTFFSRDAAESNEASYWPDISSQIDKPEDFLKELLSEAADRWRGDLPRTMMEFRTIVCAVALQALKEAMESGTMAGLFDGVAPQRTELETTRLILAEIIHDKNPALQAECIDFVHGFGLGDAKNEKQIGHKHHVGKAAVSKRCVSLREVFHLPEIHGMKSDAARKTYSKRQKGKRARPARQPWLFSGFMGSIYGNGIYAN